MNVRAEIETLGNEIREAQEQAERGELTPEERINTADRLRGRLTLVERHVATEEAVRFYKDVIAEIEALP